MGVASTQIYIPVCKRALDLSSSMSLYTVDVHRCARGCTTMCARMYNDVRADVHPCARGCTGELGWGNSFLLPSLRVQIRFCFLHAGQACSRHVARLGANKVPFAKGTLFIVVPDDNVLFFKIKISIVLFFEFLLNTATDETLR